MRGDRIRRWKLGALVAIAALVGLGFVLPAPAHANSTFYSYPNDWAPCSGFNHWNLNTASGVLGAGVFNGYGSDQSNYQSNCNPDTTEHETNAGVYTLRTWSWATTGTHTITDNFTGTVAVYGYSNSGTGCSGSYGHGTIKIEVGAKDTGTGAIVSSYTTVATISNSCSSAYSQVSISGFTARYTGSFTGGHTYNPFWGIDSVDGSYDSVSGSSAQAAASFTATCYTWGGCSTNVDVNTLTFV